MNLRPAFALALLATSACASAAQKDTIPINYDEAKIPAYTLPDPLVARDGTRIRDAATWTARRRPELLDLFAREVYGRTPGGRPAGMHWAVTCRRSGRPRRQGGAQGNHRVVHRAE
jgi:hypothetical protein